MQEKIEILVCDDDKDIVFAISKLLEGEGYFIHKAYNGIEALEVLSENDDIRLIIIDVMMPRLDGISTMMKVRESKNIPILILSAKTEESDKILGLNLGADDYITKPYSPTELTARVRSSLRRYLYLGSAPTRIADNALKIGGLCLDTQAKQLYVDNEPIALTATEYRIIELLMRNPGHIFSAEEIYTKCWREDSYAVENTVMVHIRHIREKIEINPKEPKYLKVVWGMGYKMENLK